MEGKSNMAVPLQPADCNYWWEEYLEFADPQEPRDYSWSYELKRFIARTEELTRAVESRGWDSTPLIMLIQELHSFYYKDRTDFPPAGTAVQILLDRLKYNLEAQAGTTSPYNPVLAESASEPTGTASTPVSTAPPPTGIQSTATSASVSVSPAPSAAQPAGFPPVVLHGQGKPPTVRGKKKPLLTTPQFNVVTAVLQAGGNGLNKDELVEKSGHSDARGILHRLADSDPDWKAVIIFPGKTAGRYRIG
jgi:hypothetical protein